jgi:hypothetical protein
MIRTTSPYVAIRKRHTLRATPPSQIAVKEPVRITGDGCSRFRQCWGCNDAMRARSDWGFEWGSPVVSCLGVFSQLGVRKVRGTRKKRWENRRPLPD